MYSRINLFIRLKTSTKAEAECYRTDIEKTLVIPTQPEIWPTAYRPQITGIIFA